LLLKQLVKLEIIQWPAFWSTFKDIFENEKNMLGGAPVKKAAKVLRQRIIELVIAKLHCFLYDSILSVSAEYYHSNVTWLICHSWPEGLLGSRPERERAEIVAVVIATMIIQM